ncbi:MAG: Ig-like domain-containing protein [Patescibacteria group bacterium]|jgi:hypothetical protein
MILKHIQHYLSIVFFTTLVITQALVFVAVKASNDDSLLSAVFITPLSENINIGESIYFQAMLSSEEDKQFDFVYFNLQNFSTGLNESYQASLQTDGTWTSQSIWDTSTYLPGQYYLSVKAYSYQDGQSANIYDSEYKLINLVGDIEMAQQVSGITAYFSSPTDNIEIDVASNPNLDIRFHIPESISTSVVKGLAFNIVGPMDTLNLSDDYAKYTADILSTENGYVIWKNAGTIDLADFANGNYKIVPELNIDATIDPELYNFLSIERFFSIKHLITTTPPARIAPTSVNIISPTGSITGDQINISVVPDQSLLPTEETIQARLVYRGTDVSLTDKLYNLSLLNDNSFTYGALIDISNPADLWPNGNYNLSFELININNNTNIILGSIAINLARATIIEIEPEISLNSLTAGSIIRGNDIFLNFTTNFTANDFNFSLVKQGDSTIALERTIPSVASGTSWQYNVSALSNNLTNGIYILSANAKDADGVAQYFGPITFEWQITQENTTAPSVEEISLKVYQPTGGQIGPGSVLIASANVLDISFALMELDNNSSTNYAPAPLLVDCSNTNILNQAIRDQIAIAGHSYCFYLVLSNNNSEFIGNGNYRYFIQYYVDGVLQLDSEPVVVSYFRENNEIIPAENSEGEGQFVFFEIYPTNGISGGFNFLLGSDLDLPTGLQIELKKTDSDMTFYFMADKVFWEDMQSFGINPDNYPNLPFVYLSQSIDSNTLTNGVYDVFVVDHRETSGQIFINNEIVENNPVDNTEENNNPANLPANQVVSKTNTLGIDYYSTCYDQGISDQNTCMWFRATMGSFDETCVEQGIYEAVACEDYLYRVKTDFECQENNIIDKEECKNYLLEKYGGQVDCQLDDANLCNSVLRNEYLNRLVAGQKLGQNINQAIDSLLSKNISTQDLSDTLKAEGIVAKNTLPLVSNQATKVFLARAQKEIVLEEKDKLTILNQAVLVLDTDGDSLADDLEAYYGTDINNADTDGDGYFDGLEIKNGYDPAGSGPLLKERTSFDKMILDNINIEQPKIKSKKIDGRMSVDGVEDVDDTFKLSGKAEADSWVNIYLYSALPLLMTTKTDASGNWSYDIKNSLTDGHHQVFVTINDDTGKIVKQSRPISFLVKEAQAVTADNYFDGASSAAETNNLFIYYILGGIFLVFLALGVIVVLHKGRRQNFGG